MNVLDLVFAGLIVSFTLLSIMRGAMKEILSLVGLLGGFVVASHFYKNLADQIDSIMPERALGELLSFLVLLLLGYFAGIFLTGFSDLFGPRRQDLLNRLLGGVIGFCKGTIVSLVLFWVIESYIPPFQDELASSYVAEELAHIMALMSKMGLI